MSKIALISAALVSVGFGVQMAVEEAEKLAPKLTAPTKAAVAKTTPAVKMRAPRSEGLEVGTPVIQRITTYVEKKKGNVWTLSALALATKLPKNTLSAQITHLIRQGFIRRTGRAEYVKA